MFGTGMKATPLIRECILAHGNTGLAARTCAFLRNTVAQHVVAAVGGCKDPRRIDRIYVGSGSWPFHAELFATEPFRLEAGPL